jgi:hypothetical protein
MNPGTSALNPGTITAHQAAAAAHFSSGGDRCAVLTSWKDIARYMGKGVRTVQRWEQDFGLPVRRPRGSSKKAVLARPRDLDAWVAMRCSSRADLAPDVPRAAALTDALSSLACDIETSRMLRSSNCALLDEVSASLETLRRQVFSLSPF